MLLARCARRISPGKLAQTRSTSSAVVFRPKEKRINELAAVFCPNAVTTWLGSTDPAEHAEPLDAQMPSISKPANKAMLSARSTTKATVLAKPPESGLTR